MRRFENSINAGSMADIAFLLIIFFLLASNIKFDFGMKYKLPPIEENLIPRTIHQRNVLEIKVNPKDEFLINGNAVTKEEIRNIISIFINNYGANANYSDSPADAIFQIEVTNEASYDSFISLQENIRGEIQICRDNLSLKITDQLHDFNSLKNCAEINELCNDLYLRVKKEIPLNISEI